MLQTIPALACSSRMKMSLELIELNNNRIYKINSSNKNKLEEFRTYLGEHVISETKDLEEPDSDPITVVVYKASQFEGVLVDDTSLEIEGESVGVNVKWVLQKLGQFVGRKATFKCLLAIRFGDKVFVFKGEVPGKMTERRGERFGFLPFFQPDGATLTLAEDLPHHFNARYYAVQVLLKNQPYLTVSPVFHWNGNFQH
jgi:XTP/dITP diphosphohydrolase